MVDNAVTFNGVKTFRQTWSTVCFLFVDKICSCVNNCVIFSLGVAECTVIFDGVTAGSELGRAYEKFKVTYTREATFDPRNDTSIRSPPAADVPQVALTNAVVLVRFRHAVCCPKSLKPRVNLSVLYIVNPSKLPFLKTCLVSMYHVPT